MGTVSRRNSTRTSRSRTSRMSATVRRRKMATSEPDLDALLGRFAHAISMIRVSHRSLNTSEHFGDEEFVLRTGLAALDALYTELNLVIIAIHRRTSIITAGQRRPFASRRGRCMGSASARPIAIRSARRISARAKSPTESMPVRWSPWLVFRLVSMRHAASSRVGMTRNFVCS